MSDKRARKQARRKKKERKVWQQVEVFRSPTHNITVLHAEPETLEDTMAEADEVIERGLTWYRSVLSQPWEDAWYLLYRRGDEYVFRIRALSGDRGSDVVNADLDVVREWKENYLSKCEAAVERWRKGLE